METHNSSTTACQSLLVSMAGNIVNAAEYPKISSAILTDVMWWLKSN